MPTNVGNFVRKSCPDVLLHLGHEGGAEVDVDDGDVARQAVAAHAVIDLQCDHGSML
jgi:hypothetical protein